MKIFYSEKFFWLMKMCAIQWMIALTLSGVALAFDSHAQILEKEISITLVNASLGEAIEKISETAKVRFAYSVDQIQMKDRISVEVRKVALRQLLAQLFDPRSIEYKVDDRDGIIFLKRINAPRNDSRTGSVVNGTVTDMHSQPMAGVNILVRGTTKGTTSDKDGKYSIDTEDNDVLIFSFIGYTSQEVPVNNQTTINIQMQEDVMSLGEVTVNAGYWQVTNSERTGNISRVTSEDIGRQPVSNPLQALQGRMPGVIIQQNNGLPGGSFSVRIRGQNSLRSDGNEPLYIVDGVPFNSTSLTGSASREIIPNGNPFAALNPDDIESIDVLKDADATAIYGARGANGVVLITTKKGKEGKAQVSINASTGISQVGRFADLLSTPQYLEMRKEAFVNDGREYGPTDTDITLWDSTRYTDWQQKLIGGTARTSNVRLSLSGGTTDTQYLIGGAYLKQTTVFPGDFDNQKFSGHININHAPADARLNVNFSASYLFDRNNLLRSDLTRFVTLPPNTPAIHNERGDLNWENNTWSNPYALLRRPYEGRTSNLVTALNLKYKIIEGLFAKASLGYTETHMNEFSAFPINSNPPANGVTTAIAIFSNNSTVTWNIEPQLEYQRKLGKGSLQMLVGTTFLNNNRNGEDIEGSGFTSDATLKNMMAAASLRVSSARDIAYRYTAVFSRINFNWDTKYLLNITARRDGSSRFGPENRFANFGAIGAAWIFTNENFLESSGILSFGKLRTSYGITGSDQIGDYQYLDTYAVTSQSYQGQVGLIPLRLANAAYSWEENKKFEAAIELGLLKNRLQLSTSWFRNRSSNQLVGIALPAIAGFNSVQSNFPATVQNTGLETELQSINIKQNNFTWNTAFNLTVPRNKLIEYPGLESSSYASRYEVGKSLYIQKMFHYTGIDPQTGLLTFQDMNNNGSGTDTPEDILSTKELTQQYYGGLQNTFTFKSFEVGFFLQFVKQTGYSHIMSTAFVAPGRKGNQLVDVMGRWQKPGDISDIQRFTSTTGTDANNLFNISTYAGDNAIVDASFVRLQNAYISWNFTPGMLRKLSMKAARVYAQGQNIFTLTSYQGLSPETQNMSVLPPLRTITLGFQLTF